MSDKIERAIGNMVKDGLVRLQEQEGEVIVTLTDKGRMRSLIRSLSKMDLTPPKGEHPEAWRAKRMREIRRDAGNLLSTLGFQAMSDRNRLVELAERLKAISPDGRSFIINDSDKAARDILAAAQFIRAIAEDKP